MNLAAGIFDVARRLSDRPAVTSDACTATYGELTGRAARLAGAMRGSLRLSPGDRIVISLPNRAEFFEVLLGTWTAGLCAVPANSKLHPKELAYILEKTEAKALFTTVAQADALGPGAPTEVVAVDDQRYRTFLKAEPMGPAALAPDDPAWVFFTSGTTGRPKGAVLTHRNLLFMSQAYFADIDALDEHDTDLHAAPLSHGSGLYALPFLLKGAHHFVLGGFDPGRIF